MADPADALAIDEVRTLTKFDVRIVVAAPSDIAKAMSRYYKTQSSLYEAIKDAGKVSQCPSLKLTKISQAAPQDILGANGGIALVIKLVNSILERKGVRYTYKTLGGRSKSAHEDRRYSVHEP